MKLRGEMFMDKMKDSGIKWIGTIPEEWEVEEISKLFTQRNTKVSDFDFPPLSVTKKGIVPQLESAAKSDDHTNRKLVKKDDFVINSRSDRKMSSGVSEFDGSVSLINLVMIPKQEKLSVSFVKYLLKNYGFAEEFYRWGTGIVDDLWSTNWERGKKIQLPIPPISEQQRIAKFLDEKTVLIDDIITDTKQTIEELKSYKKSLITEIVTKGLNKSVKLVSSNIEWIGTIPEHWKVEEISKLFTQRNKKVSDFDFPPLSVTKKGIVPQLESAAKSDDHTNRKLVKKDDFVINSRSDRKMSCGVSEYEGSVSLINLVMIPKQEKLSIAFVKYLLKNYGFAEEFYRWGTGIVDDLWSTNWERGKKIQLPIPSISEQQQIVKFLDEKTVLIDILIEEKYNLISEYENYKKSMIYEYVTGKKEWISTKGI